MQPPEVSPNLANNNSESSKLNTRFLFFFRTYGRIIILTLHFFVILSFVARFIYDEQLLLLNNRLQNQMATLNTLRPIEITLTDTRQRLELLKKIKSDTSHIPLVLEEMGKSFPENTHLVNLSLNDSRVDFMVTTSNQVDFGKLVINLKQNKILKTLTLKKANYNPSNQGYTVDLEGAL